MISAKSNKLPPLLFLASFQHNSWAQKAAVVRLLERAPLGPAAAPLVLRLLEGLAATEVLSPSLPKAVELFNAAAQLELKRGR